MELAAWASTGLTNAAIEYEETQRIQSLNAPSRRIWDSQAVSSAWWQLLGEQACYMWISAGNSWSVCIATTRHFSLTQNINTGSILTPLTYLLIIGFDNWLSIHLINASIHTITYRIYGCYARVFEEQVTVSSYWDPAFAYWANED